jgi:regulator of RNase E activity RraA
VRGCAGIVTDGGLRDSSTIEKLPWPAYCAARSAPLNLVRHHAVDVQVPIGCGGVAVYPDDVVVADEDGAVLIPQKLLEEVVLAGPEQERMEAWILEEVEKGLPLPGLYPMNAETKARYEAGKKKG